MGQREHFVPVSDRSASEVVGYKSFHRQSLRYSADMKFVQCFSVSLLCLPTVLSFRLPYDHIDSSTPYDTRAIEVERARGLSEVNCRFSFAIVGVPNLFPRPT